MFMHAHMPQGVCESEDNWLDEFSSFTMWAPGTKLRSLGLKEIAFPSESPCWLEMILWATPPFIWKQIFYTLFIL